MVRYYDTDRSLILDVLLALQDVSIVLNIKDIKRNKIMPTLSSLVI